MLLAAISDFERHMVGWGVGQPFVTPKADFHFIVLHPTQVTVLQGVTQGLQATVDITKAVPLVLGRSTDVMVLLGKCLVLQGLFLANVFFTDAVVIPRITQLSVVFGISSDGRTSESFAGKIVNSGDWMVWFVFQVLWYLPLHILCVISSLRWFQMIATRAFRRTPPAAQPDFKDVVSDELYRTVVIGILFALSGILSLIPFLGTPLSFCVTCFIYSYYSFEYVWSLDGLDFIERAAILETNWPFFLGFGVSCTAATFFASGYFVNAGLFYSVFPLCLLLALACDSPLVLITEAGQPKAVVLGPRLHILTLPGRIATAALVGVCRWFQLPLPRRRAAAREVHPRGNGGGSGGEGRAPGGAGVPGPGLPGRVPSQLPGARPRGMPGGPLGATGAGSAAGPGTTPGGPVGGAGRRPFAGPSMAQVQK